MSIRAINHFTMSQLSPFSEFMDRLESLGKEIKAQKAALNNKAQKTSPAPDFLMVKYDEWFAEIRRTRAELNQWLQKNPNSIEYTLPPRNFSTGCCYCGELHSSKDCPVMLKARIAELEDNVLRNVCLDDSD